MRWGILLFTLIGYAHVVWNLATKPLWWDESLSLQRAESSLWPMLRGLLVIRDGIGTLPTTDQHPFFSFLLQAVLIRLAGTSEFVLRWPAAAAATALVPAVWVFARLLARRGIVPGATAPWAALLAALSPFMLWYGQEARPYALWILLSVLSTYLLLAALEDPSHRLHGTGETRTSKRRRWIGYGVALLCMIATHYYAIFLLPVQAALVYFSLAQHNRKRAVWVAILLLASAGTIAAAVLWIVLSQGGGGNFPSISLAILAPDLINAFSLGLSVDITQVRWLLAIFAGLALLGGIFMLRSRQVIRTGGWLVPVWVLLPVLIVLAGNFIMPIYMNARHLSLLAPAWLLLVATGLSVLGARKRWLPIVPAIIVLGGFGFSTFNYYTREEYAKDDYRSIGAYLTPRIAPGDLILYYPPSSWRIFDYYLPMEPVYRAMEEGAPLGVYGVPMLDTNRNTSEWLDEAMGNARRTWFIKSGTHPYFDIDGEVESWIRSNNILLSDVEFFSQSSLRALLFLSRPPVDESASPTVPNATNVTFGGNIRLTGIDPGWSLAPESEGGSWNLPLPVTLYWQVNERPQLRAKYRLQLEHVDDAGVVTALGGIEREPYDGVIGTQIWDPGRTILEFTELPWRTPQNLGLPGGRLRVSLHLYDADTLAPWPVSDNAGFDTSPDGTTVFIPLEGPPP